MKRFFIIPALAMLVASCVTDDVNNVDRPGDVSAKIINTPNCADKGSLLVKLHNYDNDFTVDYEGAAISVRPLVPVGKASEQELQSESIYRWWVLSFDESADIEAIANHVAQDSRVRFVEYNALIEPVFSETMDMPEMMTRTNSRPSGVAPFNDTYLNYQWHYYNDLNFDDGEICKAGADINLFEAWKYCTGDPRVVVGVLDGGIYYKHDDLADNMWVNEKEKNGMKGIDDDGNGYVDDIYGYNFYDGSGNIDWEETTMRSHGTHVAGTIAAVNNNGLYVSGIAGGSGNNDGCRIMACQIFYNSKSATGNNIAAAVKYAADNGAAIINNSWAYTSGNYTSDSRFYHNNSVMMDAFKYFEDNAGIEGVIDGGVMIFAAGNDGKDIPSYPGAYYNHICVTAMGPDFIAGSYSNYGTGANICAPGGESSASGYGNVYCIASTSLGQYGFEFMQGTSMAAPHVSGCAALGLSYALQKGYSFTIDEFKALILSSVHDIDQYQTGQKYAYTSSGWKYIDMADRAGKLGAGYIDAHMLLMQIEGTPCLYFSAGAEAKLSLDNHFGGGSEKLTYSSVTMTQEEMSKLGISTMPYVDSNGYLNVKCTKTGTARITITAIVGGQAVGGGDSMGGMEVSREFVLVVRDRVAENDGWL